MATMQTITLLAAFSALCACLGSVRAAYKHPYRAKKVVYALTGAGTFGYFLMYVDIYFHSMGIVSFLFASEFLRFGAIVIFFFLFAHSLIDGRTR